MDDQHQQQAPLPWPPQDLPPDASVPYHLIPGPPLDPEFPGPPNMGHAALHRHVVWVVDGVTGKMRREEVYVVRQNNPDRAYRLIPKEPVAVRFGHVCFCVVLERIHDDDDDDDDDTDPRFLLPVDGRHRLVAIKSVRRDLINRHIQRGGSENPYRECAALEQYADNTHIVGCVEALHTDTYFFIVMPFCKGGDLCDSIPWDRDGMNENRARVHFRKILRCLAYLQECHLCHRDLSSENVALCAAEDGGEREDILIDLGMCILVPYEPPENVTRRLIKPQPPCGKDPYMAPEIYANRDRQEVPFDGYTIDIWAAGIILYAMLTGLKLYDLPYPADRSFDYFIVRGAIGNEEINSGIIRVIRRALLEQGIVDIGDDYHLELLEILRRALAHRRLSAEARNLLSRMLRENPTERLTLEEVVNHPWVMNPNFQV